jgi:ribose 5-phosphate isomerase B
MTMRIAIGSDHRGFDLKNAIIDFCGGQGVECHDCGCYSTDSVDYPDIAQAVGKMVGDGTCDFGILICGTGIGMSIAANKVKKVRAALCCDAFHAERARQHNDANILCLGAEKTDRDMARDIVNVFLTTPFEGGRHLTRVQKINSIE